MLSFSATSKFGYETGKTYVYEYDADIKTTVLGAAKEESGLKMHTTANVEILSTCEMMLKVRHLVNWTYQCEALSRCTY